MKFCKESYYDDTADLLPSFLHVLKKNCYSIEKFKSLYDEYKKKLDDILRNIKSCINNREMNEKDDEERKKLKILRGPETILFTNSDY